MKTHQVTRRQMLWSASALAATSLLPKLARAQAQFSFAQGEFRITVLSDGYISIPGEIMAPEVTLDERAALLKRLDAPSGVVRAPCNIPLIRKGNDLILVDIGSGHKYQPSDGSLAQNLQAAGIDPAAITKVVFTHAHPDHIWATLAENGSLRYPNATYYIGATEWNFWMDPGYRTAMPSALHEFARAAQRDLGAVKERAVMLKPGDDVVPGLRALDTAGHTPGHLSLELAGHEGLLIAADVINNEIVSFEHPDWKFGYDTIPDLAIRNRVRFIDRAATDRIKLLGYHWAYPGVGYAERKDNAFRFVSAS
jgi:glyoxylase-like metal-dependent hydrolase (beta-lactamase superfamily II)